MNRKTLKFAAPLVLAIGGLVASPAMAAPGFNARPDQLRAEIAQLDRQIDRLADGRRLTNSELGRLTNAVDSLQQQYRQFARGGFTRSEVSILNERIDNVRQRIATQARDGDRRDERRDDRGYSHDRRY